MKIDVRSIVDDHLATLWDFERDRRSKSDIVTFYALPLAIAVAAGFYAFKMDREGFSASITFFGIFVALLLNIQVAIFSIYQRKWTISSDTRIAKIQQDRIEKRRLLLSQLNTNLSYLVLVCCAALCIGLIAYATKVTNVWFSCTLVWFYSHFVLTMLMIVKRAHALFHEEYQDK